ncbi:MAG TPA: 30S ribosome-binding factor RbfA [Ilumatobacteraceae bacterium]|nr:30S ribosome-binding factor RbfA [Ilumatobacteraceae bacterium]
MAKPNRRRSNSTSQHRYPREARLNQSLRQVIAEELVAIDDEALDLVTITQIDVDSEMNRATVYFDSLRGEDGDGEILEALQRHRSRLQSAVGRQIRSKKTPILSFAPDDVIRSAERIDHILRTNPSPLVPDSDVPDSDVPDSIVDGEPADGERDA